MVKRVALFLMVNFLVMASITLALNLLGVQNYLTQRGISYGPLMIFCLVWGMGGSLISLLLSKPLIKWKMNIKILNNKPIKFITKLIRTYIFINLYKITKSLCNITTTLYNYIWIFWYWLSFYLGLYYTLVV